MIALQSNEWVRHMRALQSGARGRDKSGPYSSPPSLFRISHALLLLAFVLCGCSGQAPAPLALTGTLPIHAVASIQAGTAVTVTVGPLHVHEGTAITLAMVGSYGPRIYQAVFHRGVAAFVLREKDTRQTGVVTLTARSGTAQGVAYLTIKPDAPVEPLTPLIGARAITADADHWSMVVVIPFDRFGNPVAEGTRVQILVLHPDKRLETQWVDVQYLLAWVRVYSGTKAGSASVAAQIGNVHGFEGTLLEVPGWPVPFHLSADPQSQAADGRKLTTLQTDVIHDKFGNIMPDGTLVTFVVQAPNGTQSYLPTATINGVATIPFQAPEHAEQVVVQAVVLNVASVALPLTFTAGPAVDTFPLTFHSAATSVTYMLDAGPLLGSLGQYIPDGTPVTFQLTSAVGKAYHLTAVAENGHATIELRTATFPAGLYTVQATAGSGHGSLTFRLP